MEHLKYREFLNHLIETYRILKIGSIVRICVPDLDQMVLRFTERKVDIENEKKIVPMIRTFQYPIIVNYL
jgi:predicted SAM-dependent methyltransferase